MKKSILFLILFITTLSINAQVSIIPHFGVTGSYYHLSAESDISKDVLKAAQSLSATKLGYYAGIDVTFGLNNKVALKTGLLFQDMGNRVPITNIETPIAGFDQYKSISHYQYLQLPIGIQYTLVSKDKWTIFIDGSVSLMGYVNGFEQITTYANGEVFETSSNQLADYFIRKINFGAKTGLGMSYNISDNLFLRLTATGDILILPYTKDTIYHPRHYNYGLSVGVGYDL